MYPHEPHTRTSHVSHACVCVLRMHIRHGNACTFMHGIHARTQPDTLDVYACTRFLCTCIAYICTHEHASHACTCITCMHANMHHMHASYQNIIACTFIASSHAHKCTSHECMPMHHASHALMHMHVCMHINHMHVRLMYYVHAYTTHAHAYVCMYLPSRVYEDKAHTKLFVQVLYACRIPSEIGNLIALTIFNDTPDHTTSHRTTLHNITYTTSHPIKPRAIGPHHTT